MKIPYQKLSLEALTGIIEEFVSREGTDYGLREYTLLEKIEQVKSQLASGTAEIVFDQETETCSIVKSE